MIEIVNPSSVDEVWPHIANRIVECVYDMDSEISAGDMWTMCRTGQAILILATEETIKGAAICRFENWAKGTVFNCLIMVGEDMKDWKQDMLTEGARFGKLGGASRFAWRGRDGWKRENPTSVVVSSIMTMEI